MNKELQIVLQQGENQYIEFKENFSDSVIETLVAFSNFKGGKVIIGINENKKIIGIDLKKETLQNWQNEIKNKTEPFITPDIYTQKLNYKKVVVFEVISFPFKPVSFKGKYFVRRNNANHKMSASEVADMFLRTKNTSWDFLVRDGFSIDELDEIKLNRAISLIEKNRGIVLDGINDFLLKYNLFSIQSIVTVRNGDWW